MKLEKPRMFTSTRDLLISLGVLGLVMAFSVGFTGLCSYNPGPADTTGQVNEVDIDSILGTEARSLSIPVRNPDVPDNWEPNSGRRTTVDGEPSSIAGWVVDEKYYISLTQTGAELEDAVADVDDDYREETDSHRSSASGKTAETLGAAGNSGDSGDTVTWRIFTGDDARTIWAADLGESTVLLSGTATGEIYETLADKVVSTDPIVTG
ncbi:DUF4245 domain-containing protein [Corynebacterium glyciniphilum]|uniref:DUF4245 domain-containing protein n=1 Tax=Corynebacterium glyciniphilum TaxID=1404244 RepID=UPI00264DE873|nr:DUF4245 domain-containing protein [Corynebacterium glyciniphilum]MDN5682446.1 DUF4245 domain-containing protein [Corynebacterium glyciniphilum]MDN6705297.1 DUF4245 domain-containing protein [Corynebacterium glyciniphilum]